MLEKLCYFSLWTSVFQSFFGKFLQSVKNNPVFRRQFWLVLTMNTRWSTIVLNRPADTYDCFHIFTHSPPSFKNPHDAASELIWNFFCPYFLSSITARWTGRKSSSLLGSHCSFEGNKPCGTVPCGSPSPWHLFLFSSAPQLGESSTTYPSKLSPGKGERISPPQVALWSMTRRKDKKMGDASEKTRHKR